MSVTHNDFDNDRTTHIPPRFWLGDYGFRRRTTREGRSLAKLRSHNAREPAAMKLLTKRQLALELFGDPNRTKLISAWVRKKMIPVIRGGYRSVFFDLDRVLAALQRFECKEIGRK